VLREGAGIKHVVVTGHSMGAGVSTLLSYTIQVRPLSTSGVRTCWGCGQAWSAEAAGRGWRWPDQLQQHVKHMDACVLESIH
jgi:hypothetical protein